VSALGLVLMLLVSAPCSSATALRAGVSSPCSGLLVPEADARRALGCIGVDLPTCEADRVLDTRVMTAKMAACQESLAASEDHSAKLRSSIDGLLLVEPDPWWMNRGVWGTAGVGVGVAVTLAIMRALAL